MSLPTASFTNNHDDDDNDMIEKIQDGMIDIDLKFNELQAKFISIRDRVLGLMLLEQQEQQQQQEEEEEAAAANQQPAPPVLPITPRPLPKHNCRDEEREFKDEFNQDLLVLLRQLRQKYPYRQTIRWSLEWGDDEEHTLTINVKAARS